MQSSVVALFLAPVLLGVLGAALLLLSLAWRFLTSTRTPVPLCPKCLYNLEAIGRTPRCPECGTDLQHSGVIAAGTRTRKRIPFFIVAIAVLCFAAPLTALTGTLFRQLNILQDEQQTFQVLLTTGDPQLNISAMWWSQASPFSEKTDLVQIQPIAFPGSIVQFYDRGSPTRWTHTAPTTIAGTGPVPISEVWAFMGAANLSSNDPTHVALVESLRHVLLNGPSLTLPAGSGWSAVQSFGPTREYVPSNILIVIIAVAGLATAMAIITLLWRRRAKGHHTIAKRTPLPA